MLVASRATRILGLRSSRSSAICRLFMVSSGVNACPLCGALNTGIRLLPLPFALDPGITLSLLRKLLDLFSTLCYFRDELLWFLC
jgi:hypothetical protein